MLGRGNGEGCPGKVGGNGMGDGYFYRRRVRVV